MIKLQRSGSTTNMSNGSLKVKRSLSSNLKSMRGSAHSPIRSLIRRTASGSAKRQAQAQAHMKTAQVTNIFCSEMVGRDTILVDFDKLGQNKRVLELEMEDLLTTEIHHNDLTPVVGKLLFANDRPWKRIQFLDSFDICDFGIWNQRRDTMMRDYERVWVHLPGMHTKDVITFKAVVAVPLGTSLTALLHVFKYIQEDTDVTSMSLHGALGVTVKTQEALQSMLDWPDHTVKEQLAIELECGWIRSSSISSNSDRSSDLRAPCNSYKVLLNRCIHCLQHCSRPPQQSEEATPTPAQILPASSPPPPREGSLQAMRNALQQQRKEQQHQGSFPPTRKPTATRSIASIDDDLFDTDALSGGSNHSSTRRRRRSSASSIAKAVDNKEPRTRIPRPRSAGAINQMSRSLSDGGDVYAATTGTRTRQTRRNSRKSSLKRSTSDSGDPTHVGPLRRGRRKSDTSLSKAILSGSKQQPGPNKSRLGRKLKSDPTIQNATTNSRRNSNQKRSSGGSSMKNATWDNSTQKKQTTTTQRSMAGQLKASRETALSQLILNHQLDIAETSSSDDDDECSVDMEDYDDGDSSEEEEPPMDEEDLQSLHNSGSTLMGLNDLLAMRNTLDAAIAAMAENEQSYSQRGEEDKEDGPDFDWTRGVYCKEPKHDPSRAA